MPTPDRPQQSSYAERIMAIVIAAQLAACNADDVSTTEPRIETTGGETSTGTSTGGEAGGDTENADSTSSGGGVASTSPESTGANTTEATGDSAATSGGEGESGSTGGDQPGDNPNDKATDQCVDSAFVSCDDVHTWGFISYPCIEGNYLTYKQAADFIIKMVLPPHILECAKGSDAMNKLGSLQLLPNCQFDPEEEVSYKWFTHVFDLAYNNQDTILIAEPGTFDEVCPANGYYCHMGTYAVCGGSPNDNILQTSPISIINTKDGNPNSHPEQTESIQKVAIQLDGGELKQHTIYGDQYEGCADYGKIYFKGVKTVDVHVLALQGDMIDEGAPHYISPQSMLDGNRRVVVRGPIPSFTISE